MYDIDLGQFDTVLKKECSEIANEMHGIVSKHYGSTQPCSKISFVTFAVYTFTRITVPSSFLGFLSLGVMLKEWSEFDCEAFGKIFVDFVQLWKKERKFEK